MNKQHVRKLVSVMVLLGLFAFPVFAGNTTSTQPTEQQSVASAPQMALTPIAETQGNPSVKVWVNTNSGVYHCPGTRWYGNTKVGEYMTQKQAQGKGYRPAYGKFCQ
jgi:curli biogenesis system outer membrane secretion channel CsgG